MLFITFATELKPKYDAYDVRRTKDIWEIEALAFYSCSRKIGKIQKEQSRVKVRRSRQWRGLLLVNDCKVFADTSGT